MTSPSSVSVMKTPIRESGNLSEEKKSARMRLGMPAVNMRSERSVMIMYASLPVALSDVIPRKLAMRVKMEGGGIVTVRFAISTKYDHNSGSLETDCD